LDVYGPSVDRVRYFVAIFSREDKCSFVKVGAPRDHIAVNGVDENLR
jgi:hypothetical protein